MPRYDFECNKCSKIEEFFYSMNAKKNPKCPACKSKMTQIISGGTDTFIGGPKTFGSWYESNFHKDISEGTPEDTGHTKKDLDKMRIEMKDRNLAKNKNSGAGQAGKGDRKR